MEKRQIVASMLTAITSELVKFECFEPLSLLQYKHKKILNGERTEKKSDSNDVDEKNDFYLKKIK